MIIPGIVIYVVWRYYVMTELTQSELSVRPFDQWQVGLIPQIVWQMLVVLSKKGAYLALMTVAVVFAVRGMIRFQGPFDRLAIIVGAVFLGYNAFLLFAYVATFGERDALRAASLWRYNMHLGLLGVAFAAYGLGLLWKARAPLWLRTARIQWLPVVLMLIAPLVFANKLRFDKQPPVPFFRAVGAELTGLLKPGDRLLVLDPKGSGQSAVITRFELGGHDIYRGYAGVHHPKTYDFYQSLLRKKDANHILVHSSAPDMIRILGMELPASNSYLLQSDGRGGWKVNHTWKRP